jgi:outer membrane protein OmpA-like peptidoglycan-associated protein
VRPVSTTVPTSPPIESQPTVVAAPSALAAPQTASPAVSNSGCTKIVAIAAIVIFLVAALVVGTIVYIGYRVNAKVKEVKQQLTAALPAVISSDPSRKDKSGSGSEPGTAPALDLLKQLLNDSLSMDDVPGSFPVGTAPATSCPEYTGAFSPSTNLENLNPATIPLRPGMIMVLAWRRFNGDVEGVRTIVSIDKDKIVSKHSGTAFATATSTEGTPTNTHRTLCRVDFENAHQHMTEHEADFPDIFPGTTEFTLSLRLFQELKRSGKFKWAFVNFAKLGVPLRFVPFPTGGEMKRVEADDVPFPIILNDQPTQVPTIHVRGTFNFIGMDKLAPFYTAGTDDKTSPQDRDTEAYILDNPDNPFCFLFRTGSIFQVKYIKITVPLDKLASQIEQQLRVTKKAIVYGIYFDFDKDTIRPESDGVLKEIAKTMTDNPDWILKAEGHTDNIGTDAHNLDLSKRRAASVKQALVDRYHISADRLNTDGFGASRPVESNDTLEGRARNRRVELSRK